MRHLVLSIALAGMAAPALADDEPGEYIIPGDLCQQLAMDTAEPLAGKWTATNKNAGGTVGSRNIGIMDEDQEPAEFEYAGNGVLIMLGENDQGPQRMELTPQSVAENLPNDFKVPHQGDIVEVDVNDLLPCEWGKMPGFVGDLDFDLNGMGTMNMKVIVNFPSMQMGFGLLHFTGDMMGREIAVIRHFTLTRD
jgi:hypothetical protein